MSSAAAARIPHRKFISNAYDSCPISLFGLKWDTNIFFRPIMTFKQRRRLATLFCKHPPTHSRIQDRQSKTTGLYKLSLADWLIFIGCHSEYIKRHKYQSNPLLVINGTRLTGTEMWVKNSHLFISTCCRAVLFYSFHRFCAIVGLTVASISKAGRQSECQRVSHRGSSHTRRENEKHC